MATRESVLLTHRILFVALIVATLGYLGVGFVLARSGPAPGLPPVMPIAFAGVAVMLSAMIPVLRARMLPPRREPASLGEEAPAITPSRMGAVGRLQSASIVSWALCESVAVFGLVTTVLSHDLRWQLGFEALALVDFALWAPRRSLLDDVLRGATPSS